MNFNSPVWLYVAIIAVAIITIVHLLTLHRRKKNLEAFASAKLLPELSKTYSKTKATLKCVMFALGIVAICVALARPQYGYRWEESKAKGTDIIFAIDTSKSMLAEDITPNRLERAKLAVIDLSKMLQGDRVGIVAFSGQAFLQCPLTLDYDAFTMSLEALDTNVIQRGGTNIASAITEAEIAFAKSSAQKIIVLISDGEELEASALAKAEDAAKNGIIIYTLGVGGTKGEAISITDEYGRSVKVRDENGNIVKSKLNEKVLTQIAKVTGGFYGQLSTESVDKIFNDGIKKAPEEELASRMKRLAIERFQIPLIIAIILLALETLIGTRRFFISRSGLGSLLLLGLITLSQNDLQANDIAENTTKLLSEQPVKLEKIEEKAQPAPQQKKELTAIDVFNIGVDAYNKNEYTQAQEDFERAMKMAPEDYQMHTKALYNIANVKFKTAINPLVEANTPTEISSKMQQAFGGYNGVTQQGINLLKEGEPLLKQEKEMLANAKNEEEKKALAKQSPLKNQQFQQRLQQTISQCESLQKMPEELKKDIDSSQKAWGASQEQVKEAIKLYSDALSLNSDFKNAKENFNLTNQSYKKLTFQISQFTKLENDANIMSKQFKTLEKLKEDLKKLLRNDDNKNNQNNQQNKDNKQNQQNQNNQDNKQNQQNKDNQQNQQNKDNKQNKDNQDSSDKNKQQQDNKSNQQNDKNNKQDKDQKQDSSKQNQDEQAIENKKSEQQKQQQQSSSDKSKQDNAKQTKDGNQDEQAIQNQQPAQSVKQSEEKSKDNYRKAEGVMTKAEAKQLLESMKEGEKILPLRGFGEQKQRFEKSYKDW